MHKWRRLAPLLIGLSLGLVHVALVLAGWTLAAVVVDMLLGRLVEERFGGEIWKT